MKYMTLEQLVEHGYLQEVNRRFFHPLGLALEASRFTAGTEEPMVLRIQDHRDDPEGIIFAEPPDLGKARTVAMEHDLRGRRRILAVGYVEQPVPGL